MADRTTIYPTTHTMADLIKKNEGEQTKVKPAEIWKSFAKGIRSSLIEAFWSGVQIKETGDCNTDYGEHHGTLNWPENAARKKRRSEVPKNTTTKDRMKAWNSSLATIPENGQPTLNDGSRTFGLVLDKENNPAKALDRPKELTTKQEAVLHEIRNTLIQARKECNKSNTRFLRINLVKGAQTLAHTDNFKNSLLSNYLCILPPNKDTTGWTHYDLNFTLAVKCWPNFKTSFVKFRNDICIPFSFCDCPSGEVFRHDKDVQRGGYLQMIKCCSETKKAKWVIANPKLLKELKPFMLMNEKHAVAGIRDGKVVVCNKKYGSPAGSSWCDDSGLTSSLSFEELLGDVGNKVDTTTNLEKKKLCSVPYQLYEFKGWQNIHYVTEDSDQPAVRLHIFFRNMRTANVCAVASVKVAKDGNIEIICN